MRFSRRLVHGFVPLFCHAPVELLYVFATRRELHGIPKKATVQAVLQFFILEKYFMAGGKG